MILFLLFMLAWIALGFVWLFRAILRSWGPGINNYEIVLCLPAVIIFVAIDYVAMKYRGKKLLDTHED